jgi:hypothetical protein
MQKLIRFLGTGASVLLCGGCATINSSSFSSAGASDGIVYKLPEKAYKTTITYELESCGTAAEPVRVKVTDLTLASALQPSASTSDWYVIDPTALNSLFSSVDPATIELNQGMLTKVGLKSKGAATDVLKLAETVAGFVLDAEPARVSCTADASKALQDAVDLKTEIGHLQGDINRLDTATANGVTEDQMRRIERLDAKLAALKARRAKHIEESLTTKVELTYAPAACTESRCETLKVPSQERFAKWFGNGSNVADWLGQNAVLTFAVAPDSLVPGTAAAAPPRMGYKGIYYRRPQTGRVTVSYLAGKDTATNQNLRVTHLLDGERIPQLGTLARIGVEGTVFGSRAVSLEFDADGDLKKYEMSSTGVLAEIQTSASGFATAAEEETELARLSEKVDLAKKKKELIDAEAALEAAEPPQ